MKGENLRWLLRVSSVRRSKALWRRTRAIMDCFVEAVLKIFSNLTPLMSSSNRPSSIAALTLASSFRLSRARLFFEDDGSCAPCVASVYLSASCSSL